MLTTDKINCSRRTRTAAADIPATWSGDVTVPACRAVVTGCWWPVKWSVTMSPREIFSRKAKIQSAAPRNKTGHYFLP
jgi:hypothetical protein